MQALLNVTGMTCGGCTGKVTQALKAIAGVGEVKVSLQAGEAAVEYDERLTSQAIAARRKGAGIALLLTGLATVVTMSWTNFAIDSSFKWLLLAPAIIWFAGIAAYALEGTGE